MAATATITHCIFDMDGLLLDTESFYTVAQQDILARYGKQFTWDLKAKMMGKKALPAAQLLVDELGLASVLSPQQFLREREELLDSMFPDAELMPGVLELLRHLKKHGVPMCVATSSHERHLHLKTRRHKDTFAMFDHIVTGDAVAHGKPAPDIFRAAAERWSPTPEPEACLVFEDAPSGVEAARAAKMRCVMVPDPNLDVSAVSGCRIIQGLADFDPASYGLPAYGS